MLVHFVLLPSIYATEIEPTVYPFYTVFKRFSRLVQKGTLVTEGKNLCKNTRILPVKITLLFQVTWITTLYGLRPLLQNLNCIFNASDHIKQILVHRVCIWKHRVQDMLMLRGWWYAEPFRNIILSSLKLWNIVCLHRMRQRVSAKKTAFLRLYEPLVYWTQ